MKLIIVIPNVALALLLARDSAADSPPEHTAAEVATAPPPGYESGRIDARPAEPTLAIMTRGILFVPQVAATVVLTPVRGVVHVSKRYEVVERIRRWFTAGERDWAVLPILGVQPEYGLTLGLKFTHTDVFGGNEQLRLRALAGFDSRTSLGGSITTGDRLGIVQLQLNGLYDDLSRVPFFGIGNGDEVEVVSEPIDVFVDDEAFEVRYARRILRSWLVADIAPAPSFHIRPAIAFGDVELGRGSTGIAIDQAYDPMSLVGLEGYQSGYGELELLWDDRGASSIWDSPTILSRGSFASVFAGRQEIQDGPGFWRYGGDVQHFIRLGEGPRVISGRLHAEAISGSIDEVPFTELPTLGGANNLRGYRVDRFRDRIAAVGSVEYSWDLTRFLSTSIFVDVGRVYSSFDDLTFADLRVGYGATLHLHNNSSFLARLMVASSSDGGVLAYLSFDPVFDVRTRVERR